VAPAARGPAGGDPVGPRVPVRRSQTILPRVAPVIPVLYPQPFDHPDWMFEPKYDGFRGILSITPTTATLHSKRGRMLTRFGEFPDEVRDQLRSRDAILDGEVLALDPEGRADFRLLLRLQGTLHFAAFDLLWHNGQDLRGMPLVLRRRRLEKLIPGPTPPLSRVLAVEGEGRSLFEAAQRLDLEGIVAKRKADTYGEDAVWYKIKNPAYTQAEGRGELFDSGR
jgi:bifunctional non-homologous end joining protein LigD